ncbi:MAG: phosphatidylserine/phosphatidylglycerophosphate/cardiolipin synthase family protein [Elusimicrobia bacterium]|nr:phosphatidylserine/phosphatidylglycerophosphate/cardiolipin synthase family protein [Elusimicrobiota bacterium]
MKEKRYVVAGRTLGAAAALALWFALPITASAQTAFEQLKALSLGDTLPVPVISGTVDAMPNRAAARSQQRDASLAGFYNNSEGSPILSLIGGTQATLDIEIYQMGDSAVRAAIRQALKRGVRVRIVKEPDPVGGACRVFDASGATLSDPGAAADCADEKRLVRQVRAAGGAYVPFKKDQLCQNEPCWEHGKMVISDGAVALMSTGNFDKSNLCDVAESPEKCNRDYTMVLDDPQITATLTAIFEKDLAGVRYDMSAVLTGPAAKRLTVGPLILDPLLRLIRSAKRTIELQNQYLKEPEINAALITAAHRGVRVNLNITSLCAFGMPNEQEAAKATATYSAFDAAGIETKMFNSSILINGFPGYLHAKAIVVDGERAWVGSANGSVSAVSNNREFGLLFGERQWVQKLSATMKADFMDPREQTWREGINCKTAQM